MTKSQRHLISPKDACIDTLNDFFIGPIFIEISECLWKRFKRTVAGFPIQITMHATVGTEKSSCGKSIFSSWGNYKKIQSLMICDWLLHTINIYVQVLP